MNPDIQITCSFALTFGVPIAFAVWDLWHLGPTAKRLPPGDDIMPDPAPLPDAGITPRTLKPLPACLIPQRAPGVVPQEPPVRVRELA